MSDNIVKRPSEFMERIKQIRNSTGTKLLSPEELLFITADEIARSYTMNEGKPAPERNTHSS